MSTIHFHQPRATGDAALQLVRQFVFTQGDALCEANRLLGGPAAERRCLGLLARLRGAETLRRGDVLDLIEIHRLLTLEHVGDPEREETAAFALIHPADPRVHDLCLLADKLLELLRALAEGSDGAALAAQAALTGQAA